MLYSIGAASHGYLSGWFTLAGSSRGDIDLGKGLPDATFRSSDCKERAELEDQWKIMQILHRAGLRVSDATRERNYPTRIRLGLRIVFEDRTDGCSETRRRYSSCCLLWFSSGGFPFLTATCPEEGGP